MRTEGSIAGLQLSALSLRERDDVQRFVDSLPGSHRYILDYLIEDTGLPSSVSSVVCFDVAQRPGAAQLRRAIEKLLTARPIRHSDDRGEKESPAFDYGSACDAEKLLHCASLRSE